MSDRHYPWSISMLHVYENCAYQYKMKYVLRIPEPERPLPKGKTEHANDRGSRIHTGLELYVGGESQDLPREADDFADDIEDLRALHDEGRVMLEHDWCYTADWLPCTKKDVDRDNIMIVDFAAWIVPGEWLLIGDYKSGRPYPVKHMDQMQMYALGGFKRYPDVVQITTELWYLDQDMITSTTFKPKAATAIQNSLGRRVARMRSDDEFRPASHQYACRYCPYKEQCEFAETGVKVQGKPQSVAKSAWHNEWKI